MEEKVVKNENKGVTMMEEEEDAVSGRKGCR